jgi:hypothetical protein
MQGNHFEISNNGSFISSDPKHSYDEALCNLLSDFLINKSVLDLGCGDCTYLGRLRTVCSMVKGYDGNPFTEQLSNGLGGVADLSRVQQFQPCEWVVSLETGEHIPREFEDHFIENLCKHCTEGMILSWGHEGQPGEGHVNCHNTDYIIRKIYNRKFLCDVYKTQEFRAKSSLWWFRSNLLVFYKVDSIIP